MVQPRFIQIHTLHSYSAALLNRDDSGLAKRMLLGGTTRTRISSQCLKWHWRGRTVRAAYGMAFEDREFGLDKIGVQMAKRSRNVVDREVMDPLTGQFSEEVTERVRAAFNRGIYGNQGTNRDNRQPLLLGLPEVEFLSGKAKEICERHSDDADKAEETAKELFDNYQDNFKAMREQLKVNEHPAGRHGGLEGALFGRMVTSDPASNIDAAIHVAHAFTVHEQETEDEYFTAVDDLQGTNEEGASFIGDTEINAGLFYGYVVVDVPGLVSNLEGCDASDWQNGDRELAAKVVKHLVHLIATVSPGAKLGSTAPYAAADLMLIEAGNRQPRSLANAYRRAVRPLTDAATGALCDYLGGLDECYGAREARRVMSVEKCEVPGAERLSCDALATWAADAVRAGEAA